MSMDAHGIAKPQKMQRREDMLFVYSMLWSKAVLRMIWRLVGLAEGAIWSV